MSVKNQSDLEINFPGTPPRGESMRIGPSLLNTPGLVRSLWDFAAVKTNSEKDMSAMLFAVARELEWGRNGLVSFVLVAHRLHMRPIKWECVDSHMNAERTEYRCLDEMYGCDVAHVLFDEV